MDDERELVLKELRDKVWSMRELMPSSKLILMLFIEHYDLSTGYCKPSRADIERFTGLCRSAVKRALVELTSFELIEENQNLATDARNNSWNLYRLLI